LERHGRFIAEAGQTNKQVARELNFPRFFVFQRARFMLPAFSDDFDALFARLTTSLICHQIAVIGQEILADSFAIIAKSFTDRSLYP
jgi:hypothetical protein